MTVPGLVHGRLRFRWEWSDETVTGCKPLDGLGTFLHFKVREMLGILHFPRVLPLSLHGRMFCLHTDSMVVYIVCEGWVLSFPSFGRNHLGSDFVLSLTEHFLCSCPHPGQAECGCRPGFPSGSHFHRVDVGSLVLRIYLPRISNFPDSGPLLLEGHLQALLFCFSMSGSTGLFIRMPWIPFWIKKFFPFNLCLPSSGTHAFSFQENCSVQGSHSSDCAFEFEQYMDFDPGLSRRISFSSSLCF